MNILELYSGIGGMHFALKKSGIEGQVICSIEINPTANKVYSHNFPKTFLHNGNIENITADFINQLNIDTILMSPPCQPFTRNGLKKDINDTRTNSLSQVLTAIPFTTQLKYIVLENVKGFETSVMRDKLVDVLTKSGFSFQEFILSPTQFGVPNTRHRYYCLAKKLPEKFKFDVGPLLSTISGNLQSITSFPLSEIIDKQSSLKYKVSENVLIKYFNVMDICGNDSHRSCCFTKGYSRYIHGTGSVYSDKTQLEVEQILNNVNKCQLKSQDFKKIEHLNLRFFSPREVSRLMCFPETFHFPAEITDKQKYMMLGNSINVLVVSELIKYLML